LNEGYGLKNMGPNFSDQRHTHTIADVISRLGYDPSVNQPAESNFKTKVNKNSKSSQRQNWRAVSNIIVQTKNRHQGHEDCNLVFTHHGKEDGIYSLRTKIPSKMR
jgi:hypothetical protein